MVDSVMDNLSLRTQRRGFMQLELSADTSKETVQQLVLGIQHLLQLRKDQIESSSVFLSDIIKNSFVVQLEFFTAPIPIGDFNTIRQDLYLSVIEMMEEMNIRLAAKENEIVVTKDS
jgi:MscS family membrane protein